MTHPSLSGPAALFVSSLFVAALHVGCSGSDDPGDTGPDGGAVVEGGVGADAGTDPNQPDAAGADAAAGDDAGTENLPAAELIPTDGSPYLVANIDGKSYLLDYELNGTRSPDETSGLRGSRGLVLPIRDLELRMPSTVGSSACEPSWTARTSVVLRTSDLGTLASVPEGGSCTIVVSKVSQAQGDRIEGTFSAVVTDTSGARVEIKDGAFSVPTLN